MVQKKLGKPKASQAEHEQQYKELIELLGRLVAVRWREQHAAPRIVNKPRPKKQTRPRKR